MTSKKQISRHILCDILADQVSPYFKDGTDGELYGRLCEEVCDYNCYAIGCYIGQKVERELEYV